MKLGHDASKFRKFPFRVLVVCKSGVRRDNLVSLLRKSDPSMKAFARNIAFEEFRSDPLGEIDMLKAEHMRVS